MSIRNRPLLSLMETTFDWNLRDSPKTRSFPVARILPQKIEEKIGKNNGLIVDNNLNTPTCLIPFQRLLSVFSILFLLQGLDPGKAVPRGLVSRVNGSFLEGLGLHFLTPSNPQTGTHNRALFLIFLPPPSPPWPDTRTTRGDVLCLTHWPRLCCRHRTRQKNSGNSDRDGRMKQGRTAPGSTNRSG